MKKFLTIALAILMICALSTTVSAKQSFDAAKGTAVIDGVMDDCYTAATAITLNTQNDGTPSGGATGTAYVCYDSEFIYLFVDVTDSAISTVDSNNGTIWNSDSIEAYFDFVNDGSESDTTTVNAGQWTAGLTYQDPMTWGGYGMHNANYKDGFGAEYKAVTTDKGWTMEMKVPFGKEFKAAEGATLGFGCAICDDTTNEPARAFQVFASEGQGSAWSTTGSLDTLTLSAKEFVPVIEVEEEAPAAAEAAPAADTAAAAPATTAALTMDMSVIMGLAALAISGGAVLTFKKRK